jgi:hypothetical protein
MLQLTVQEILALTQTATVQEVQVFSQMMQEVIIGQQTRKR